MPVKSFDVTITVVSPKRVKGTPSSVVDKIKRSPDVKKSGDRVAVTGAAKLEQKEEEGQLRRNKAVEIIAGYQELEDELEGLLDEQVEIAKDVIYRFDPDVEPDLMRFIGELFGSSEPVITSKMYADLVRLTANAAAELSSRLVVR